VSNRIIRQVLFWGIASLTGAVFLISGCCNGAAAADASFVGVLAFASEKDVAERLGLSEEVQAKLNELIERREGEALEIVLANKDLPPTAQTARLVPFVAESERQGFALLTVAQREKLQQIRIARQGMSALAEPGLVQSLGLSEEQQATVKQLLSERANDLTKGGENERRITRAIYERKFSAVLTDGQRSNWRKLAGFTDVEVAVAKVEAAPLAEQQAEAAEEEPETSEQVAAKEPASSEEPAQVPADEAEEPEEEPEAVMEPESAEEQPAATEDAPPAEPEEADANPEQPAEGPVAQDDTKPTDSEEESAASDEAAPPESEEPAVESETGPADETMEVEEETDAAQENADVAAEPSEMKDEGDTVPSELQPAAVEEESPTETRPAEPAVERDPASDPMADELRFNFDAALWKDVLEWFAEQADLAPAIETIPTGTFTYKDDRVYTVDQAIDLLNSYLLTKGYTLVRRERMLLVLDLENPIPDELVTLVTLEELGQCGRYELVKCMFPLARMKAEDAAEMIQNYLGPQGDVIPFPNARQILVTETAGKLRTIRDMIARVEDPAVGAAETVVELNLENVSAEEVLTIARPLLGLEADVNTGEDISISVDMLGIRMFATGSADKLLMLKELIPLIDKAPAAVEGEDAREPEKLEPRTYLIQAASPELVLRVLQTMLANLPGVRLEVDSVSRKLIAMAHPSEHEQIKETIELLEGQTLQFEVIPVERIDPQLAVMAVNKFFGLTSGDEEGDAAAPTDGPIVDGDPITGNVWVRGTAEQIQQIKDLVAKLEGPEDEAGSGGNVRMIPLSGAAAQTALETVEQFWNRSNKIRMVTPSALTPSDIRLRAITPLEQESGADVPNREPTLPVEPPAKDAGQTSQPTPETAPKESPVDKSAARRSGNFRFQFASQPSPSKPAQPEPSAEAPSDFAGADIRVAVTPGGIFIASDDLEALDAFENLLRSVSGPTALLPQRDITVFYLKYAKAEVAHTLLQEILGGHTDDSTSSLLGDMASNLLGGGLLGSLVGGMAGGGGGDAVTTIEASGLVNIVPDPRLNALVVEANQADLDLIEELLQVIDRESSITDIQTSGMPRLIPVVYGSADEVAAVVNQVFADRLATSRSGRQQPSPEDFIRALRGQRGGREQQQARGEEQKMTVGVDQRSNALIVTAPEPLFLQVEALVRQIDQPGSTDTDVVEIVPLRVSNPEVVQETLEKVLASTTSGRSSNSGRSGAGPTSAGPSPDDIRRRMEFIQRLRSGMGGPGGGMMGRGGPGGGRPSGAPSSRGSAPSSRGGGGRPSGRGR